MVRTERAPDSAPEVGKDTAPVFTIRPSQGWMPINLGEIWVYRELLFLLTWRDVKVRYKQTALGFLYAVIQPLMTMVVFAVFFGNLAKIPSEGIPYPLFSYAALLPWTLFAGGVTRSVNSLIAGGALVAKVYCPRLIMPLTGVLSPIVDFGCAFTVLIGMMFYFGYPPTIRVLWLPAFLLLAIMTSLAVGLWLSAANVRYRDVGHLVGFLVQVWMFVSPVVYPSTLLPEKFRVLYGLNPMAGVIEGFRWTLLGTNPPSSLLAVSATIVAVLLVSGAFYFRRVEKTFADVI